MRGVFFFLTVLLLIPFGGLSQNNNEISWQWSNTYGNGNDHNAANHLVVDDSANMYVAGFFRGELIIQTDSIYGNPNENRVFVAKFDSLGTLIWLKKVDWGYYVNQIRLDADNDLRVLCNAGTMIVYDGMDGTPITYYSVPNSINDGNSATPFGQAIDFRMDEFDNMYFLFRYEDMNNWWTYSYVSKYASPGDTITNLVWEDTIKVGFFGVAGPTAFALDDNHNVYVTGNTDFISLSHVGVDVVSTEIQAIESYVVKYNAQGDVVWLETTDTQFSYVQEAELNTADSSLFLTGYTVVGENFFGDTLIMDTTNQQQIFLSKFDLEGNHDWSRAYPLETKTLKDYTGASWGALGSELQISDSGYVYLKGSFTGSIIFHNDTLYEDTSSVVIGVIADDAFIAKLDGNGNPIWGKYAGNSGGQGLETGDFYVDPTNDVIYYVGYWSAPNNLNKMATPTNNAQYIFLGKEGEPSVVSVDEIPNEDFTLLIYPNPSEGIYYLSKPPNSNSFEYKVVDINGSVIHSGECVNSKQIIDLSEVSNGFYFLKTEYGSVKLLKQ